MLTEMKVNDVNIKISIIIPIYNAKKYIRRCLDTLINQSLREIEIICVLDCPTDGTDKIVEEYKSRDSRIIVVKNDKNQHVAESRNIGLRIARGEYIGFSDHDDYRSNNTMYEQLYLSAQNYNSDIVVSNAIVKNELGVETKWKFINIDKQSLLSSNILPFRDTLNSQKITHCIWHSIYKRSFLQKNSIFFKDRDKLLDEDRLFNFECYFYAGTISYVDNFFYVWANNNQSITQCYKNNYASLEIRRTKFFIDFLEKVGKLNIYKNDLWNLISLETKEGLKYYTNESIMMLTTLGYLMHKIHYPIFGYKYDLNILSRKRLKLMLLNIRCKLLYFTQQNCNPCSSTHLNI